MKTREIVLARIERFLAETGMTAREFGLRSVGDHKFVTRLRQGTVTLGRIERAEEYMDENRDKPPDIPKRLRASRAAEGRAA